MRKLVGNFMKRCIFSEDIPLELRTFNLLLLLAIFAEIVADIIRIVEGSSLPGILAITGMIAITIAAFLLFSRRTSYKWGIQITLVIICDILFPLIFFTNGGINSGLTGYFVLCIILNFFLLRGKVFFVLTLVHIVIMISCFIIGKAHPSLVIPLSSDAVRYVDTIYTILMAGFLAGFLIRFQIRVCESEKKKADTALRAKADFLANVSHEIRTPLNTIIGLGELELDKNLPGDTMANLEKIHDSGMSLLCIINDLLDISKIESGHFEIIPVEYQTASFINDTISMNMVLIGSKPITFQLEIDETLPRRLYGDELRFRQILNNLLSNAFKYTHEGLVWLKIHGVPCEDGGPSVETGKKKIRLVCTVEDTGIGMRPEDMEKVFSTYNQADTRSTRRIEGIGLGLSICKNLVDLMGGTITVKSEFGKGSAFTVDIPQVVSDPVPIGPGLADKLSRFRFYAEKRNKRKNIRNPMPYGKVLIVDDVSTNLDVAKGMMLPYGLTIDCAASGKEAIRIIGEGKIIYDAVFMDHMMPGMDGIETVKIIRSEISGDYAKRVPIIALTANASIGSNRMFLENGFQDFLSKPIDPSKLDVILQKWVRNKEKEEDPQWAPAVEKLRQGDSNEPDTDSGDSPPLAAASPAGPGSKALGEAAASPVEGVDFAAGVKRMGNKEAVFIRILSSFAAGMPALLSKIRSFDSSNLEDYRITIHGIKGASYGICANDIGKQAEALEMAAKNGDIETILAQNDNFILHMEKLLGNITRYVTSP